MGKHKSTLKEENLRKTMHILSREFTLDMLVSLYKEDWQTASEVAEDVHSHIATAVNSLSDLYDIGLVNMRIRKRKSGMTKKSPEYQLKNPVIKIEFNIEELLGRDSCLVLFSMLHTIYSKSKKIFNSSIDEIVSNELASNFEKNGGIITNALKYNDLDDANEYFKKILQQDREKCETIKGKLTGIINEILTHYESRSGEYATSRLLETSITKINNMFGEKVVRDSEALNLLPKKYLKK